MDELTGKYDPYKYDKYLKETFKYYPKHVKPKRQFSFEEMRQIYLKIKKKEEK